MFVLPWLAGSGNWGYVQAVWDRWQSLNAAALAFLASLIAFNISRFNENRQRERNFIAAKAFLPSTLSELCQYCERCAVVLRKLWEDNGTAPSDVECPELPINHKENFSNCITYADPEVGDYLSNILILLQVHEARLRGAVTPSLRMRRRITIRENLVVYAYRLAEIQALVDNLFAFARSEEPYQSKNLAWEDFHKSYSTLGFGLGNLYVNESMNLEAFTKLQLNRSKTQTP
jgi:hypothetical protein